jgi:hypothetical protein
MEPLAPPQEMMTEVPWATRPSIADLTVVPLGKVAFDTLPSPLQLATQPPSVRKASVTDFSPAVRAVVTICEPLPRVMSA